MTGPKSRVGATRFVQKKVYISKAEIAEENNRTTNFGEKCFVYLQTHLLNLVFLSIFSGLAALMSADIARNL